MSEESSNPSPHHVLPARNAYKKTESGRRKAKAIILTVLRFPEPLMVAADCAGVHRTTVRAWMVDDAEFDAQVKDATLDGGDVLVSVLFAKALTGDVAAINLSLRVMGILEGVGNRRDLGLDSPADFAIEELSRRAIEQGFASTPKPLKVLDDVEVSVR